MATKQGSLDLLNDPVAQKLLKSTIPARLAYIWKDGTPRNIPIWFHWNGKEVVVVSPPNAPKVPVLQKNPKVALTIDNNEMPHKILMIRGSANVEIVEGIAQEYAAAAKRYSGEEAGAAWIAQLEPVVTHMARIAITPEWVGILDFETRFPSAVAAIMGGGG